MHVLKNALLRSFTHWVMHLWCLAWPNGIYWALKRAFKIFLNILIAVQKNQLFFLNSSQAGDGANDRIRLSAGVFGNLLVLCWKPILFLRFTDEREVWSWNAMGITIGDRRHKLSMRPPTQPLLSLVSSLKFYDKIPSARLYLWR